MIKTKCKKCGNDELKMEMRNDHILIMCEGCNTLMKFRPDSTVIKTSHISTVIKTSHMAEELIENIAELEHKQWMEWSRSIINELMGDPFDTHYHVGVRVAEKHQEWLKYWKDYSELSEEMKERDREWARKVINIIEGRD